MPKLLALAVVALLLAACSSCPYASKLQASCPDGRCTPRTTLARN